MGGFLSPTGRCRLDTRQNCLTLVQLYSQYFVCSHQAISRQEKTVTKNTKTKLSHEKYLGVLVLSS